MNQRAGERELLLHAAGQAVGAPFAERRQLGHREQAIALGGVAADAVNLRLERDVLVDGQVAVEREPLRQVADQRR